MVRGAESQGVIRDIPNSAGYRVRAMQFGTKQLHVHALKRLKELDDRFQAALRSAKLPVAAFVISSALRTVEQQQELGGRSKSAHSYGASIDVFQIRTVGSCKKARAVFQEVLLDFRKDGKVYLCPESDLLHLTVR